MERLDMKRPSPWGWVGILNTTQFKQNIQYYMVDFYFLYPYRRLK